MIIKTFSPNRCSISLGKRDFSESKYRFYERYENNYEHIYNYSLQNFSKNHVKCVFHNI